MTPLLAILEFTDYAIIAVVAAVVAGVSAFTRGSDINVQRLERSVRQIQNKLDAFLKHHGVELPAPPKSGMSAELEQMARDPSQKIAAIRLYREENPGVGLREAKEKIEAFYEGRQ